MSRYTPPSPLQLQVFERIPSVGRIAQGALLAAARDLAPPDQIADALETLVDLCLLSTMRHTADGVTQTLFWRTGLRPIVPPTQEELSKMVESKASRIERLIVLHGPISRDDLVEQCHLDGMASVTAKNVRSMIQDAINRQRIVTGKDTAGVNTFMTPSQAEIAPVAQDSSLPKADDDAMPRADPGLLATANRELGEMLKSAEHALEIANFNLAAICRALDVPNAGEAVSEIERMRKLIDGADPQQSCDEPRRELHGQLGLLAIDGERSELSYLEPYITEGEGQVMAINLVHSGGAERAYLVRALYHARRHIQHGAIEAPAIQTLRG